MGSKKIDKFMSLMLYELELFITKSDPYLSNKISKISCTRDEIIYEIIKPEEFNYNDFLEIVKIIDP